MRVCHCWQFKKKVSRDAKLKNFITFIENDEVDDIDVYQWLSLAMANLGVSHNDFWDMPFFMLTDLLSKLSPKATGPTRKEILANMRYNKEHRGWI